MVRLADLCPEDAEWLLSKECRPFEASPFVQGPPLAQRRVALITTAGLHLASQSNFDLRDTGYRVVPGDVSGDDLIMSHTSVNFDRSGYQQDVNTVFPIDRLRELRSDGEIGNTADYHYAVMGAGWEPEEIADTANQIAGLLKEDGVNAAILIPV